MRYAIALLVFFSFSGCIDTVLDDPVTSANGIAFISSHILIPSEVITVEEIEDAIRGSSSSDTSSSKVTDDCPAAFYRAKAHNKSSVYRN